MSASQCAYFEEYQLNNDPPVTVFTSETSTGDWLLRHTHERLMSHHANRGIAQLPAAVRETIPTMGVLSRWSPGAEGYGAGWHSWRRGGVGYPSSGSVPRLAHQPWPDTPFYVANEAFGEYSRLSAA